jgi:hypothetical protein
VYFYFSPCQGRFHFLLGQGRALPTELLPQYNTFYTPLRVLLLFTLPRSFPFPFWGKVVLYQLSYFRRKERATSAI